MRLPLPLLLLCLLLAACQSRPIEQDFDPQRDFGAYRAWSWKEPALQYRPDDPRLRSDLTEQRLREAIAAQLDQRGLRHTDTGGDLQVQAWLIVEERQEQIVTSYAGWGQPWRGYWGGPGLAEVRTVDYRIGTLQIDLYDNRDGRLVWRGSSRRLLGDDPASPTERAARIRENVARILSHYPPR